MEAILVIGLLGFVLYRLLKLKNSHPRQSEQLLTPSGIDWQSLLNGLVGFQAKSYTAITEMLSEKGKTVLSDKQNFEIFAFCFFNHLYPVSAIFKIETDSVIFKEIYLRFEEKVLEKKVLQTWDGFLKERFIEYTQTLGGSKDPSIAISGIFHSHFTNGLNAKDENRVRIVLTTGAMSSSMMLSSSRWCKLIIDGSGLAQSEV